MDRIARSLVITALTLASPASASEAVLRVHGVSAALATLAGGPPVQHATHAGVRSVTATMRGTPRKLTQAGTPLHAHPSGPVTGAARYVNTGGTRINTDGMQAGTGNAGVSGAAGEQQYVQLVGASVAVYRKHDGVLQSAPASLQALFAGAGLDACTAAGAGAPQVLYDQLEKRWLLSWLAGAPGRHVQCIALSTSADAAGSYYRYAMRIAGGGGEALQADDARMALWPDAYYFTFNLFDNEQGVYRGPRICALGRLALLRGRDAAIRCQDPGAAFGPAVAASVEGDAAPPMGTPAPVLSLDFTDDGHGSRLLLWRFPLAGAAIKAPIAITVAPFRVACFDAQGACIGQPHPGATLYASADRLLPRAVYRHDGTASLVLAHAVRHGDEATGMRWYELRGVLHAAPDAVHVYQQGTHAPDSDHRAMGGIGIDKAGNIALAYSVAGPFTPPGVRYTGRERSDPPGRMQSEEVVVNGNGVQPGGVRALAASGALTLDPTDNCTFWYTQHYLPVTGPASWHTRIASFKFRNCM